MFFGRSNRGPLGGARRGSTPPPPWFLNPSSVDFWLGFFYNFNTTKILIIVVIRGRGDEFLFAILCIAIVPVVIPVPSRRGCCRISLSGPWRRSGLRNPRRTDSLSSSQYFNIIVQGVSVCAAWFLPLGNHPCTFAWRVRPPLFRFNPFLILLEFSPLLDLAISWDLLEPTLSLLSPLTLPHPLLPLEGTTASSSSPPLSPS